MRAPGRRSIDDWKTESPPMVDLLRILEAPPGVRGARCSGAGQRACCLALVDGSVAAGAAAGARRRPARLHPARTAFALASGPAAGVGAP
jgi:hypothetical protein